MYTGTKVLNAAFQDRFVSAFRVEYPGRDREMEIINQRVPGLSEDIVGHFIDLAAAVREATENMELYTTFSTRRLINLARKYAQTGSLYRAIHLTVLNRLEGSERNTVWEMAQRHFGDKVETDEEDEGE